MMNQGKYIVINGSDILIFAESLNHSDVGRHYGDRVTSAGSVMTGVDKNNEVLIQCYGRSMTLGIGSDPEHDSLLAKYAIGINS